MLDVVWGSYRTVLVEVFQMGLGAGRVAPWERWLCSPSTAPWLWASAPTAQHPKTLRKLVYCPAHDRKSWQSTPSSLQGGAASPAVLWYLSPPSTHHTTPPSILSWGSCLNFYPINRLPSPCFVLISVSCVKSCWGSSVLSAQWYRMSGIMFPLIRTHNEEKSQSYWSGLTLLPRCTTEVTRWGLWGSETYPHTHHFLSFSFLNLQVAQRCLLHLMFWTKCFQSQYFNNY